MANEAIGLTTFMIRQDQLLTFQQRFSPTSPEAVPLSAPLNGYFIPVSSTGGTPPWVSAVNTLLQQPTNQDLRAQSPAGLLVIEHDHETFVVTFGHAWQKLEDGWLERDFGRRVALNSIAKDGIVEIRAEQVFAKWHIASDRAPKASAVDEFGVEFDRDLVASIEGVPSDTALGKLVRGSTSLRLNLPITALSATLDKALKLFHSNEYRKRWPEIDNLAPVKDQSLVQQLERKLDDELSSTSGLEKITLFTPTYRRDDPIVVESYVFGRLSKSPAKRPYLSVDSWIAHLAHAGDSPSVSSARATKVHLLDGAEDEIKSTSVFDCLGCEVSIAGLTYVLASGVWYEVLHDFLRRINNDAIQLGPPKVLLPAWDQIQAEGEYNASCAKKRGLLAFDAKMISFGGGSSRFEFCDLLHPADRTMYFAKIVSRSSGMSHLVEQVRRTSELCFASDPAYRARLKTVFKTHYPHTDTTWLDSRPRAEDWNLCLVSLGRQAQALPFFAKCGLVKLAKELNNRGHQVSFLKV